MARLTEEQKAILDEALENPLTIETNTKDIFQMAREKAPNDDKGFSDAFSILFNARTTGKSNFMSPFTVKRSI